MPRRKRTDDELIRAAARALAAAYEEASKRSDWEEILALGRRMQTLATPEVDGITAAGVVHPVAIEIARLSEVLLNLLPCHRIFQAYRRHFIFRTCLGTIREIGMPLFRPTPPLGESGQVFSLLDLRAHLWIRLVPTVIQVGREEIQILAPEGPEIERDIVLGFCGLMLQQLYDKTAVQDGFPGLRAKKKAPITVKLARFLAWWYEDSELAPIPTPAIVS